MRKPRILYVGEFSKLNTGYACISRNLLKEFVKTDKYIIGELACYYNENDQRQQALAKELPWVIYGNLPQNRQETDVYNSNLTNEFGAFKFIESCLKFQPDIILDVRDQWMCLFIEQSPFRHFYKTVMMPTVDAAGQNVEWIDLYQNTDYVLTYTKFGEKVLREESGNTINLKGVATPAVDTNLYFPVKNRSLHKQQMGLDPNSIIVGMVARNQKRKLYPELADAFVQFLQSSAFSETSNVYLYWHTAYPDVGWNIPELIKNNGLSHKVLLTYFCNDPRCGFYFPSLYKDSITVCPKCHQGSCVLSNSQVGITDQALATIYNCLDLYVQFSTIEGLGIPCLEAAMCGVPVCGTYYSGIEDIIDAVDGYPIHPRTYQVESETGRKLALPSIQELSEYIKYFSSLPLSIRLRMGMKTASLAKQKYGSWKDVADKWMNIFDQIQIPEQNPWLSPIDYVHTENIQIPTVDQMNDEQFTNWLLTNVLHRPNWVNSFVGLKMWRDLSWGRTTKNNLGCMIGEMGQLGFKPVYEACNRESITKYIMQMRNSFNQAEILRDSYIRQGIIK